MSIGFGKLPAYSWDYGKPCTWAGLCACLKKTQEGPKLSPLADLEGLWKQEVKAKTEL